MAVSATTMIMTLLTSLACDAAVPRMRPPTTVAAPLTLVGNRTLASARSSRATSMINTSMSGGYGTPRLAPCMLSTAAEGSRPGLNDDTAM